ncbi:hypothetical protein Daus18300_004571 [Diaporthe australafricana]|uniref:Uncharacterized protein n=1 Tax=Diaporthe australafricana TaxID=127596 RepID=A0ABR3X8E5_9PEZI
MVTESAFLNLPRELRDAIYRFYVSYDEGLVYKFDSGKMAPANNEHRIDLALSFTCKQVASELEGLILKSNTITFSSVYSDEIRVRAARFHNLRVPLTMEAASFWYYEEETAVTVVHGCFDNGAAAQRPTFPPPEILALDSEFPAWSIPTDDELLKLSRPYAWKSVGFCDNHYCHSNRQLHTSEFWNGPHYHEWVNPLWERWGLRDQIQSDNRGKYRFSAASVAIKFISSLPDRLRLHLRHIRLLENNVCVAFPESHAQGLISFCVENPNLRVERRVNLWKAIVQQPNTYQDEYTVNDLDHSPEGQYSRAFYGDQTGFTTVSITNTLALWIMEAAALGPAGMPKGSFTLVLDAGPGDVFAEVFQQYVQRDAAWQRAWEIASQRTTGKTETEEQQADDAFIRLRSPRCYIYDGFPQAIDDIVNNKSKVIQCTFDPGLQLWDAEAESNKYKPHSADIWDNLREEHTEMFYWRQIEPLEYFAKTVYDEEILPYDESDDD